MMTRLESMNCPSCSAEPTPASTGLQAPALLQAHDLRLVLDGHPILDGLSLEIAACSVHALLGPNGSGKSSVACAIMGCSDYLPESGSITLDGERIDTLPLYERARRGVAFAWQEPARFEGLSVADFLSLGAQESDLAACLKHVGLAPHVYLSRRLDRTLSGGERKRIELAGMLALRPRLVMLDEPTAGIDLLSMPEVLALIDSLKSNGASILLITHQEEVAAHADVASQLCRGRIVYSGEPGEVIAHYKTRPCQRCDGQRCEHE